MLPAWCCDQPLEDPPVRPLPPALHLWHVAYPTPRDLRALIYYLCDGGRGAAQKRVVNPTR